MGSEEGTQQAHYPGLQESSLHLFKGLPGRVPWDSVLEKKRNSRELDDIQGLSPPGSQTMHHYKEEIRKEVHEVCMDEQRAPGQTGTLQRLEEGTGVL